MAPVYYIKPDNENFLASFANNPCLESVTIKHIAVDPENRRWTICLGGNKQGDSGLWDQLAQKIVTAIPEIDDVVFEWEEAEDDIAEYMKQVMQSFTPQPVNYSTPQTQTNQNGKASNGGHRGGRRRSVVRDHINGQATPIKSIVEEDRNVVISGEVVASESRETRTGKTLLIFSVYDGTDSIACKLFLDDPSEVQVSKGSWLTVLGNVQYQSFDNQLSMMVRSLAFAEPPAELQDDAIEKRIELHLHTKMSGLDGIINVQDVIKLASSLGHSAIAITDHGVIQAFPEAFSAGKKYGIKILYGLEGYLIDQEKDRPYHIVLIAKNEVGLKNLYRLVSLSHMEHFYRRPRIPRSELIKYRSGIIVGSACEAGEVFKAVLNKDPRAKEIAEFYDYLEIQPLGNNEFLIGTEHVSSNDDLIAINKHILRLGRELGKPVVATGDVHFLRPEDGFYRTILLAGQGFEDAERQAPLYFRTTNEMLEEFSYLEPETALEIVVKNPQKIADQCQELIPIPQGLHPPEIENAAEMLREMAYDSAHQLYGRPLPEIVSARLERELDSIIGNGYASLYWIAHKLVKKSLDDGYLVGSRGSVGSSLVATMCSITEVNPLPPHYACPECHWSKFFEGGEAGSGVDLPDAACPECGTTVNKLGFDIPFEVFMGFHGDKVPDIDLNFSGEYQSNVHHYTEELFGSDHVFRAGTIGTLAEKTAYGFIMKYLEQINETRRNAEVNRLVSQITGVRRTTGQHPGGMMVVPANKDVFDFTPIQYPANDSSSGTVTTHFDYHAIHDSLVKLDILGHDDPTMLRMLEDITGIPVQEIPLDDPDTMAIFSGLDTLNVTEEQIGTPVGTLGIPEFGTPFVRQMLIETRPTTFSELVRISGLSHGTNVWNNNAQDLIKSGVTDLNNAIACRDDIMVYLIHKKLEAGDAFRIMEQVRKGKGLTDDDVALMKQHDVPDWYIDSCQKISYMFPKAHAVAYVTMAFRIAYFKVHKPLAYYATYFSIRAGEFDADLVKLGETAIRQEIAAIDAKGYQATAKEKNTVTILEIVLEAMARGVGFHKVDLYRSADRYFEIDGNNLLPPLAALPGVGANAAASIAEARKAGEFKSIEDLRKRARITKAVIEALRIHGCLEGMSETNQLTLF